MDKGKTEKAFWDSKSHKIFLDICEEEVIAKNKPTQCLNLLGYTNLIRKFNERTGKNYVRNQFKNHWDNLKKDYNTWKQLLFNASGLGRDPNTGAILADDEWWKEQIGINKDAAKFQYAALTHEEQMRAIFGNTSVSNEHARVPQANPTSTANSNVPINLEESGTECEDTPGTSKSSKKRTTGCSPTPSELKKPKNAVKMLGRILDLMVEKKNQPAPIDPTVEGINEVLDMVKKDGADEDSHEYFIATQLFEKKETRAIFKNMKNSTSRLAWLRKTWEEKKKR